MQTKDKWTSLPVCLYPQFCCKINTGLIFTFVPTFQLIFCSAWVLNASFTCVFAAVQQHRRRQHVSWQCVGVYATWWKSGLCVTGSPSVVRHIPITMSSGDQTAAAAATCQNILHRYSTEHHPVRIYKEWNSWDIVWFTHTIWQGLKCHLCDSHTPLCFYKKYLHFNGKSLSANKNATSKQKTIENS